MKLKDLQHHNCQIIHNISSKVENARIGTIHDAIPIGNLVKQSASNQLFIPFINGRAKCSVLELFIKMGFVREYYRPAWQHQYD